MSRFGLDESTIQLLNEHPNKICLLKGLYLPGFWVCLAAFAKFKCISWDVIEMPGDIKEYAQAIGLEQVLSGTDNYQYQRKNQGINYCSLINLCSGELTDCATSLINNCIRSNVTNAHSKGINRLTDIVGELLDNVWSHGKSTGYAAAQVYPKFDRIEFAIADHGLGFKQEMELNSHLVESDRHAIDWCITKGNSTKHADDEDEWAQWLPPDAERSPYGKNVSTKTSDNHHQGLGLYKLVEFVKGFGGKLHLITGSCMLHIDRKQQTSYHESLPYWQGVAVACSFSQKKLATVIQDKEFDRKVSNLVRSLQED